MEENKKCHCHDEEECTCGCADGEECTCGDDCDCESEVIEVTTDDGRKVKFYLVDTIEYDGKEYAALTPAEEAEDIEEDSVYIFELSANDDGSAELFPIDDQDLLDKVYTAFVEAIEDEDCECDD
ncbi:MAG: DUF1292 domain-containing protein [Clostridia bacterium]|nr:DUF1292 domain-containing protein [Clostridia bacterium]